MPDGAKPTFGKYEVKSLLGEGGMGRVWEGFDPDLEVRVAIKELKEQFRDQNNLERFYREAQIAAKCRHQNIVLITDLSKDPPYFVMEFLPAKELTVYAHKGRPISLRQLVRILGQVCDGLGFLHGRGIFHRDLKPANIMLLEDDAVKITDFGISKAPFGQATMTQVIMGTIPYMSPEQITTPGKVDHRVDVWALGVILYELTQRRHPFPGEGDINTIFHIVHSPVAEFTPMPPAVEGKLRTVLGRALEKDPERRIADTKEFKGLLRDLLEGIPDPDQIMFPYESGGGEPATGIISEEDILKVVGERAISIVSEIEKLGTTERKLLGDLFKKAEEVAQRARTLYQKKDLPALEETLRHLESQRAAISSGISEGIGRARRDAKQHAASGRHAEAAASWKLVLAIEPDDEEAKAGLAKVEQAAKLFEAAKAVDASLARGKELAAKGDLSGAVAAWTEVIRIQPGHEEATALLRDAEAKRAAKEEIRNLKASARKALESRKPEEAIAHVEKALKLDPADDEARTIRSQAQQMVEEATRSLHADALRTEGRRFLESKEYDRARISFSTLLELQPGDKEAKQALEMVEKGIAEIAARDKAKAAISKADAELQAGNFEAALELFNKASQVAGDDPAVRSGRDKARKRLEALRQAEKDARAREKSGHLDGAVKLWEQVLQLQPSHPAAGREIERIQAGIRAAEEQRKAAEAERQRVQREAEERRKAEETEKARLQREAEERRRSEELKQLQMAADEAYKEVSPAVSLIKEVPREDHEALGARLLERAVEVATEVETARQKADAKVIRARAGVLQKAAEEIRSKRSSLIANLAGEIHEAGAALEEVLKANAAGLKAGTVKASREAIARAGKDAEGPALHPMRAHVEALRRLRDGALREIQDALKAGREAVQKSRAALDAAAAKNRRAVARNAELAKRIDALGRKAASAGTLETPDALGRLAKEIDEALASVPTDLMRFLPHAIAAVGVIAAVAGFFGWRWMQANTRHPYELHVVPWGRVVSVQGASGAEMEAPEGDSPFHELSLLPGSYSITVENPATGKREALQVTIPGDASGTVRLEGPDYRKGIEQLKEKDPFFRKGEQ